MTQRIASLSLIGCLLLPAGGANAVADPLMGTIAMFGFNFAPRGWALCSGQLEQISQNSALFSLLGTMYGGDGQNTFGLPDFRGRVPMHFGQGPGLTNRVQGQKGGQENHTQPPTHSHAAFATAWATDERGDEEAPGGHVWARKPRERDYSTATPEVTLVRMHADAIDVSVANTGPSNVSNMQPYLVVNFSIALQGVYPSRN